MYSSTPKLPLTNRPTVILSCSKDGPKEQSPPHSTHFQRVSFEINKFRIFTQAGGFFPNPHISPQPFSSQDAALITGLKGFVVQIFEPLANSLQD